ncbi:SAM-dependent DNA methyltransferase [Patescibacteria group bacterium]|nr:SAM-dependent DNA methyltransferase [Patescibacteria group bacterium]
MPQLEIAKEAQNKVRSNQVKSRQRVTDHGEVFTAEREVNAMLDLVKQETENIDSNFLEPACGTGNFLVEVLRRKLQIVEGRYKKNQLEFERYSVIAISSIYGVDILEDNVKNCCERLFKIFDEKYTLLYKDKCKEECKDSIRFILNRNILWGDALTLKTVGQNIQPIIFSNWSLVRGSMIKRSDYIFAELIPKDNKNYDLFNEIKDSDLGTPSFIPNSVKEFPLTHFLKLTDSAAD